MGNAVLLALLAYLLGCVMGGQVVGALRGGVDLRREGSGNLGATNALRTRGARFAVAVLFIDVLKGVLAVLVLPRLPAIGAPLITPEVQAYVCGVAVTLGHCFPVFSGFRGGKGVATLAGVFGALMPAALPWLLAGFALIVMLSGYVSLATIFTTLVAMLYVACFDAGGLLTARGGFTLAMAVLVVWTHRDNLRRLLSGTENRFEKAMVLRRWHRS